MRLPKLGSFWMLLAALGFAIMGALVKIGANKFSAAELVFYRSIFGFVVIWLYVIIFKFPIKTPHLYKQSSRALVGFGSLVLFFYAIAHLKLATAVTLNYTSALFLAGLTPFLLHEKPKKTVYIALLIGFTGVIVLLQPSITQQEWLAGSVGLMSGFGAAWAYVHVRQLGQLNEPDWRTVFYFTLISSVCAGGWMLFDDFHALNLEDLMLLIALGVSATIAQLAMTRAYRTGDTLVVASLAYVTVILASLFGAIWWHEALILNDYLGIGLIILSGMMSVWFTPRK
jgi:drug/metabolite transporter (DMT)-like permease